MHGTLLNVMWQPVWEWGLGGMDTYVCMAEFLHCSPETITTLLIGHTLMQNKKLKKTKKNLSCNAGNGG